jgi:hypothetical protein
MKAKSKIITASDDGVPEIKLDVKISYIHAKKPKLKTVWTYETGPLKTKLNKRKPK